MFVFVFLFMFVFLFVFVFVFAPIASTLVQWAGWKWNVIVQVMAGICSLGFICGLALAPRAKKQTRCFSVLSFNFLNI